MTTILSRATGALTVGFILIAATLMLMVPLSASAATAAALDESTLASTKTKPTIEGTATDLKTVRVVIENEDGKSMVKKTVRVSKSGEWKLRVTKTLKHGTYEVTLRESSKKTAKTLDTGSLVIGSKSSTSATKSSGLISVASLPLLAGGTASQGATIPVAYIKVQNASSAAVNLEGFTLKQNGSASAMNVIGFATSDDKGGSRTTIGGLETTKQFKNGLAYVPLAATIAPNQVRIFTIKAILSKSSGADLGKQLFLDVSGVTANGGVKATYPIRGAAWTLIQ